jgi:hypothetical protein
VTSNENASVGDICGRQRDWSSTLAAAEAHWILLVGARGFEPPTPCAQGGREAETETIKTKVGVAADEIANYKSGFNAVDDPHLTVLTAFNMIGDSFGKLMPLSGFLLEEFHRLGESENKAFYYGLLQFSCGLLYVIPRTSILGAILVTGFLCVRRSRQVPTVPAGLRRRREPPRVRHSCPHSW